MSDVQLAQTVLTRYSDLDALTEDECHALGFNEQQTEALMEALEDGRISAAERRYFKAEPSKYKAPPRPSDSVVSEPSVPPINPLFSDKFISSLAGRDGMRPTKQRILTMLKYVRSSKSLSAKAKADMLGSVSSIYNSATRWDEEEELYLRDANSRQAILAGLNNRVLPQIIKFASRNDSPKVRRQALFVLQTLGNEVVEVFF